MLASLIIVTHVFLCPQVEVINDTNKWTEVDARQLSFSKQRCSQLYYTAPCLTNFWKAEFQTYRAFCGKELE